MQSDWPTTLGVALALMAVGALIGDLWARVRAPGAVPTARRRRPHYLLALSHVVSSQPDEAIQELSQALRGETDALEAYLALGNLLRESGQTERAIDVHKSLLHRPGLSPWERTQVLLSLGMDFKRAGLVDRAERTFREVEQREPDSRVALRALQQLAEETGRWQTALQIEERIQRLGDRPTDHGASIRTEWGWSLVERDPDEADGCFRAALDERPDYAPARIGLGVSLARRQRYEEARDHLEQALDSASPWASVALHHLRRVLEALDEPDAFASACRRVLDRDPRSWRAWLLLAREQMQADEREAAGDSLRRALGERPRSLTVQRQLWDLLRSRGEGIDEFVGLLDAAIDDARLLDPFVCLRCGFKSAEPRVRCPHCHRWNTMTEERQD